MKFKIQLNNALSDNIYCYDKATKIALDLKTMFNDITVKIIEVADKSNNK